LKKAFTTAPILAKWNSDSKLIMETDASDQVLVAILFTHVRKEVHPIAFHSRTFSNADLNYNIHDKELLAVTNVIWPYLHQFFIDSHGLNGYGKPLKRPFYRYQSCFKAINNGRDIRQINW